MTSTVTHEDAAARIASVLERPERARWFRAPGRVNLIGDHTDYNGGLVLPLAIDRSCVLAANARDTVRARSLDLAGTVEIEPGGGTDPATVSPAWGRYVAAVVRELGALGRPAIGMDAVLASEVPVGSGLSSSAALEVACAIALAAVADWHPDPREVAAACRDAEELATGVPCGIMDQLASLYGRAEAVLLIDCRSLEIRPVPLPARLDLLVVHSGLPRTLVASAYSDRRRACEQLAHELGVPSLRDATEAEVADAPLGRHVVSEIARVRGAELALRDGDLTRLGRLLSESHASLRDDFHVSTPELDVLVEELQRAGAHGARLTGAGFGGCVVAACDRETAHTVGATATARYRELTGREPWSFVCSAADGAGPATPPASG